MLRGLNEITKRVKQPNEMNLNWLSLNSWGPMSLHGPGARAICMLDMISVISNYVCCITVVCYTFFVFSLEAEDSAITKSTVLSVLSGASG